MRLVSIVLGKRRTLAVLTCLLAGRVGAQSSEEELFAHAPITVERAVSIVEETGRKPLSAGYVAMHGRESAYRERETAVVGASPAVEHGRAVARVTFLDGARRRQFLQPLE
jgi:hypothetical protein